jgi:hypothetical protein
MQLSSSNSHRSTSRTSGLIRASSCPHCPPRGIELSVIDDEHHRIEAAGVDTILHLGERSYCVLNLLARRRETQRLASHSLRGLD